MIIVKTLFIFLTVAVIQCAIKPQYEFGLDQSVHWAAEPYHALQGSSGVPRSYSTTIRFSKPFQITPVVILAPIKLDGEKGMPMGFDIAATDINKAGFTIQYSALATNRIFGFDISWGAISDPNIYTYEYETNKESDISEIQQNTGTASSNLQFKFPAAWSLKTKPNIALFMIGIQISGGQYPRVSYSVPENYITKEDFVVTLSAKSKTQVTFVRFNAIIGIPDTLYVGQLGVNWKSDSPLRVINPASERVESISTTITDPGFHKFPRFPMYGINGFYYNHQTYMRIFGKNFLLTNDKLTVDLGTWQDTLLVSMDADFFIYVPRPDLIEEIKECAIVYELCDYKGDSFMVCDRNLSFPKNGWSKPVKSFKVPVDRVLKLFELENIEGRSIRIEQNTPCMEEVKFSLIQMVDMNE